VVRLQILDEIETLSKLALKTVNITMESLEALFSQWKSRISFSLYSSTNQVDKLYIILNTMRFKDSFEGFLTVHIFCVSFIGVSVENKKVSSELNFEPQL